MGNLPSQLVEEDEVGDFELEKAVQKGDVSERGNTCLIYHSSHLVLAFCRRKSF
jgi:hypothetical protein